jgi:FAD:protein FMN transferase
MSTVRLLPVVAALLVGCPSGVPVPPAASAAVSETAPRLVTVEDEAMGGLVRVDVRCPNASLEPVCRDGAMSAIREIQRIGEIADAWNNPDGDVARINGSAGGEPVKVGDDVGRMVNAGQTVAAASQGAFDITVGALSGLWDIPGAELPDRATIQERLKYVDWTQVSLKNGSVGLGLEGQRIVLGAVVKGDAADRALAHIPQGYDVRIDVGTDYIVRGEWEVEVPLPGSSPRVATFKVRDCALVTSGTWVASATPGEGYYKQVVDARNGEKAEGASVSVVAHPRGVIADALSTTLRVTGADTSAVDVLGAWGVVFDAEGKPAEVGRRGAIVLDWSSKATPVVGPAVPAVLATPAGSPPAAPKAAPEVPATPEAAPPAAPEAPAVPAPK